MSHLPSLPQDISLAQVFMLNPERAKWVLEFHEQIMRGPSAFSVAEREMIFAFGSGVNECKFCHGAHKKTAAAFGVDEGLFADLLVDVDRAPVDDRLKPVLKLVRKLTETPSKVTKGDADAVFAAGWDEQAYLDAVTVCALHNFMNRIVDGTGVSGKDEFTEEAGKRLATVSYKGTADKLAEIMGMKAN